MWKMCSVTRWRDCFSILGHLNQCKFPQKHKKLQKIVKNFAKSGHTEGVEVQDQIRADGRVSTKDVYFILKS